MSSHVESSSSSGTELSVLSVSSPLVGAPAGSPLLSLDRLLIRGGGALLLGVVWSVGMPLLQDTRR